MQETKYWHLSDSTDCPVKVRGHPGDELDNVIVKSVDLRRCVPWHPYVLLMDLYNRWRNQIAKDNELWHFRQVHLARMSKVFMERSKPDALVQFRDLSLKDLYAMTRVICGDWDLLGVYVSDAFSRWIPSDTDRDTWMRRYAGAWCRHASTKPVVDGTHTAYAEEPGDDWRVAEFVKFWNDINVPESSVVVMPNDYDLNDKILGTRKYHDIGIRANVTYIMPFVADSQVLDGLVRLSGLAGRNDIDNVRVNADNTVSIDMALELGDSYPSVDGLRIEALKAQARTVDNIYRNMTDLVHSIDNLKEVTDNADSVH